MDAVVRTRMKTMLVLRGWHIGIGKWRSNVVDVKNNFFLKNIIMRRYIFSFEFHGGMWTTKHTLTYSWTLSFTLPRSDWIVRVSLILILTLILICICTANFLFSLDLAYIVTLIFIVVLLWLIGLLDTHPYLPSPRALPSFASSYLHTFSLCIAAFRTSASSKCRPGDKTWFLQLLRSLKKKH